MAKPSISPEDFERFLLTARKHKVMAFELGEVKVSFHAAALVLEEPVDAKDEARRDMRLTEARARAEAAREAYQEAREKVLRDPVGHDEDPDLFYSTSSAEAETADAAPEVPS